MIDEHKAKQAAYAKQYYQDNKTEIAAQHRQYYQDNKIKITAQVRQYQQNNGVEVIAQKKQYYQDNKTEIAAQHRQYYQDHKPEAAARRRGRYSNDIDFKLKVNVTVRVGQSIGGVKQYKHSRDLLGCTISEVREHLERQFQPGMTWDNWNLHGWHIDHIIPLESFDFADYEQQKQAWHYTNLRPLWAEENLRKGNKIIEIQLILL